MNENCGKITITNTTKALGDFFYRYCQCILFGIFVVCLCIIVQIKFKIVPFLAYSVYADAINEILVNLSQRSEGQVIDLFFTWVRGLFDSLK